MEGMVESSSWADDFIDVLSRSVMHRITCLCSITTLAQDACSCGRAWWERHILGTECSTRTNPRRRPLFCLRRRVSRGGCWTILVKPDWWYRCGTTVHCILTSTRPKKMVWRFYQSSLIRSPLLKGHAGYRLLSWRVVLFRRTSCPDRRRTEERSRAALCLVPTCGPRFETKSGYFLFLCTTW